MRRALIGLLVLGVLAIAGLFAYRTFLVRRLSIGLDDTLNLGNGLEPTAPPLAPEVAIREGVIDLNVVKEPFAEVPCYLQSTPCSWYISGVEGTENDPNRHMNFVYGTQPSNEETQVILRKMPAFQFFFGYRGAVEREFKEDLLGQYEPNTYYQTVFDIFRTMDNYRLDPAFVLSYYEWVYQRIQEENLSGTFPRESTFFYPPIAQFMGSMQTYLAEPEGEEIGSLVEQLKGLKWSRESIAVFLATADYFSAEDMEKLFGKDGKSLGEVYNEVYQPQRRNLVLTPRWETEVMTVESYFGEADVSRRFVTVCHDKVPHLCVLPQSNEPVSCRPAPFLQAACPQLAPGL